MYRKFIRRLDSKKVTDIKPFVADCFRTNRVFIKVYTEEGIDGVGEATLEYKEKALLGAVLMSALSAVEMALWDILGKSLNVPAYQLPGGKANDKIRIYGNGWFAGAKEPEKFGGKAKTAVQRGVTAMKRDPFGKNDLIFMSFNAVLLALP